MTGIVSRSRGRSLGGSVKDWGWDEGELVRRCREGVEAGYVELVRRHRPRLFTLAYRLTNDGDLAEDVVQETFLAAFRSMERFEPRPSLSAWLNTIAIRLARKAAARHRPTSSLSAGWTSDGDASYSIHPADPAAGPEAVAETAELRRALVDAIAKLPFNMRAAVVLRHVMGFDYAEGARAMDVPLNTFKSHLLRGTRQLRSSLTDSLVVRAAYDSKSVLPGELGMAGSSDRGTGGNGQVHTPHDRLMPALPRAASRQSSPEDVPSP